MRTLTTLIVAVLAALGGRLLATARAEEPPQAPALANDLAARVAALRVENERLAGELERHASLLVTPSLPAQEVGEAEIAAALARWRAAHPEADRAVVASRRKTAERAAQKLDLSAVSMEEIVRALSGNRFHDENQQLIFQELRDSGRIDEYLAAIEALAAADPENADLQVSLGHAYLQKLFGMAPSQSTELGQLAWKSDQAFDRALELDEGNWNARFSKAVSLSNWPAFLGRAPEAIEHFEILIEEQEGLPPRPEFAMPYLFLGNMHQAAGKKEQAIAAWKAGLALFPNSEELLQALELAGAR